MVVGNLLLQKEAKEVESIKARWQFPGLDQYQIRLKFFEQLLLPFERLNPYYRAPGLAKALLQLAKSGPHLLLHFGQRSPNLRDEKVPPPKARTVDIAVQQWHQK